jgi:hypothetical protein
LSAVIPGAIEACAEVPEQAYVMLTAPAPSGGVVVDLASDTPAVVTVPASVTVPEDAFFAAFTLTPVAVGSAIITASYDGVDKTAGVDVNPYAVHPTYPNDAKGTAQSLRPVGQGVNLRPTPRYAGE